MEALPGGEIIPGVLDMPGTPQKSKVATKLAEKLGRIAENKGKPNISLRPVVPTRALLSSWGDNEGNIKEMGGKYARTMLSDTPPAEKLFQGYWRCQVPL